MLPGNPEPTLAALALALSEVGRTCYARGWLPATSGNLSARIDAHSLAITASGRDKGALGPDDIIRVDMAGQNLDAQAPRPSAETLLHCQLYRWSPEIAAVLHTHSRAATVLSRAAREGELVLRDFELAKALSGVVSHEGTVRIPVVPNDQDMARLAQRLAPVLARSEPVHGYLIAGHGLYTWGNSLREACRHLEALEFMLECALCEGMLS